MYLAWSQRSDHKCSNRRCHQEYNKRQTKRKSNVKTPRTFRPPACSSEPSSGARREPRLSHTHTHRIRYVLPAECADVTTNVCSGHPIKQRPERTQEG
ncbi:hypothetical protein VTH06DRAFT_8505 [Thermothelomyces fergusii]